MRFLAAALGAIPLGFAAASGLLDDPVGGLAPLPVLLLLFWLAFRRLPALGPGHARILVYCAVAAGGLFAAWLSARIPVSVDGEVYHMQARLLAQGRLSTEPLSHPELFHYYFVVPRPDGSLFGAFPPGWPAVLALGELIALPWLVNPILTATLVLLVSRLARAFFPGQLGVEVLAAWLVALGPSVLGLGGTFMSHTLAANLTVAVLLLSTSRRDLAGAAGTGAALGALFCVRPLNGLVLGLLALAMATTQRRPLAHLGAAAAAAIALGSMYPIANHATTGDALVSGQDAYFALTEPNASCHRLGLGDEIGCVNAHNLEEPGYHVMDALGTTAARLTELGKKGFGPGLALLLPLVLFFRRLPAPAPPTEEPAAGSAVPSWPLAAAPAATLAAYALFYYHGNFLGPRLLMEASVVLAVIVAAGAMAVRPAGVAIALAGLLAGHVAVRVEAEGTRWMPYEATARLVEEARGERKLVFVDGRILRRRARWTHYSLGMVLGDVPGREAKTLFAHDLGDGPNQAAMAGFPNHVAYRLLLEPVSEPRGDRIELSPSLVPLARSRPSGETIPLAARFPLTPRTGCGFAEPVDVHPGLSALRLVASRAGSVPCSFDLGRAPSSAGRWEVSVVAAPTGEGGSWLLRAGGRPVGGTFTVPGGTAGDRRGPMLRMLLGPAESRPGERIELVGTGAVELVELAFEPAAPYGDPLPGGGTSARH